MDSDPSEIPEVIAGSYEAAARPARRAFRVETGLRYRAASAASGPAPEPEELAAGHFARQEPRLYREYFVHVDPSVAVTARALDGGGVVNPEVLTPGAWARSEIHHDGAALRLQGLLAAERLASAARGAALDQLCHGAVIVSEDGTVLFANAPAEALAQEGAIALDSHQDGLRCPDRREAAQLAKLIASAAKGGCGGTTRISRGPKQPILAATVSPLPMSMADEQQVSGGAPEMALVILRDLGATSDAAPAQLMDLFALTGAEAAIVPQLLAGESVSLIAQSRGVSVATVRAQVAKVLAKTGATNLRALATMIAALGCG